jgi:hypothetical protein
MKKIESAPKKLRLNKNTLRSLSSAEVRRAVGGLSVDAGVCSDLCPTKWETCMTCRTECRCL